MQDINVHQADIELCIGEVVKDQHKDRCFITLMTFSAKLII